MDLKTLHRNLKALTPERVEGLVLMIVKRNENILLDFNTQQLLEGKDSLGKPIDPIYASAHYAEFKLHLNPRGVVDLKVTGEFHNSIFLSANVFPIIFKASDPKTPELLEKYGVDILGVQKQNLKEFTFVYLLPDLRTALHNLIRVR